MIKDITKIHRELQGFHEIELPYEFPPQIHIKYITLKDEEESFYIGGMYQSMGHNCLFLKHKSKTWKVPLYLYTKQGQIRYTTRLFIPDKTDPHQGIQETDIAELQATVDYQQTIIERLTETLKDKEDLQKELISDKQTYEELLQPNRYHLKQLSLDIRDKDKEIQKYKQVIQMISTMN